MNESSNDHETVNSSTKIFDAWLDDQLNEDDEKIKNGEKVDFSE